MTNVNDETVATYQNNFDAYIARTPKEVDGDIKVWLDAFLTRLPRCGSVFELGSAFGRDASYITSQGFSVQCTDVTPRAVEYLANEGHRASLYDFRDAPRSEWVGAFDGVFANAVLLHAPAEVFTQAIKNILSVLKLGGIFAFSLKAGEGEEVTSEKMDAPRYFKYWTEDALKTELVLHPIDILELRTSPDGKWLRAVVTRS